jgi:hypothetical protein
MRSSVARFLFVPLTTVTFATLDPSKRGDGTDLYNLSRNTAPASAFP